MTLPEQIGMYPQMPQMSPRRALQLKVHLKVKVQLKVHQLMVQLKVLQLMVHHRLMHQIKPQPTNDHGPNTNAPDQGPRA